MSEQAARPTPVADRTSSASADIVAARPARGTRPANRRQLIVAAAADLFYRRGYATVGMGEVAEAVAIGPSALYRHFKGKQDLLAVVVGEAIAILEAQLTDIPADEIAARLAELTLEHRRVGVLWQREARHLEPGRLAELRASTKRIGAGIAALIARRRPGLGADEVALLPWCVLATANSVSFHSLSLPEPDFAELLTALVDEVIEAPVSLPPDVAPFRRTLTPNSRREVILAESTVLFAQRGFTGVSMDDIGARVGVAGPSLYNHFAAKTDILIAVMHRGDEWMWMDLNRVFAHARDPRDGLRRLIDSYVRFVLENPDLIQLLVTETAHLPDAERRRARATQRDYIAEWVHLAQQVHPDWDPITARIRVQAAQTTINDIALVPRMRVRHGIDAALCVVGEVLLRVRAG